jgi:hypothetical protein
MQYTTAIPSTADEHRGGTRSALDGLADRLIRDGSTPVEMDGPPDQIKLSDQQAQQFEQTRSLALPAQTIPRDHELDADGFPPGVSDDEKRQELLQAVQDRKHEAAKAEQAGDPHHAAWARQQADKERQRAATYERGTRPRNTGATAAVVRSNGTPAPRRAESSGKPPARRISSTSSSSSDDSESDPPSAAELQCKAIGCGKTFIPPNGRIKYCPDHRNNNTCQKAVQRKADKDDPEREAERHAELHHANGNGGAWTLLCDCKPKDVGTPKHNVVDKGLCHKCGRPRTAYAVAWEADPAPPSRRYSPLFVSTHGLKKWSLRYGDRKRKPVKSRPRLEGGDSRVTP